MKRIILTDTLHIRHATSVLHVSHAFFQFIEVSVTIFHFLIEIIISILSNPLLLLQPLLYSMDESKQRLQCLTLDCGRKTIIFNIKYVNMLINFTLSNKKNCDRLFEMYIPKLSHDFNVYRHLQQAELHFYLVTQKILRQLDCLKNGRILSRIPRATVQRRL